MPENNTGGGASTAANTAGQSASATPGQPDAITEAIQRAVAPILEKLSSLETAQQRHKANAEAAARRTTGKKSASTDDDQGGAEQDDGDGELSKLPPAVRERIQATNRRLKELEARDQQRNDRERTVLIREALNDAISDEYANTGDLRDLIRPCLAIDDETGDVVYRKDGKQSTVKEAVAQIVKSRPWFQKVQEPSGAGARKQNSGLGGSPQPIDRTKSAAQRMDEARERMRAGTL